ncbi:hypothetical protein C4D60_Mb06t08130 [Musa balbisiana]|uniref:Uncharacterized protein n=1 Tax=Musa balbisiana TaxID=52838 RepID=A0A4S8ILF5_MUSBA|nr:hypothetical protein C4D60_Mb06t08130 [Musa balbisiana]
MASPSTSRKELVFGCLHEGHDQEEEEGEEDDYGSDNSDMKKKSSSISNLKKRNREHKKKKTSSLFFNYIVMLLLQLKIPFCHGYQWHNAIFNISVGFLSLEEFVLQAELDAIAGDDAKGHY